MAEKLNGQKLYSSVSEFYNGKSLFITGAAGYLGTVLLEIFLRCLPGISNIYILLRPKKGVDPESRKKIIFGKMVFRKLLENNPNIVEKVHVIPGDITQPNLGITDKDLSKIVSNVSIVFHLAASISFFKNVRQMALQNCLGTKNVMELCNKIKKLDVLVYTSTAYANCNHGPDIEENIYRLPFTSHRFLDELMNGKEGEFERLTSKCKPDWPNAYTFSKCLCENIINDSKPKFPVAIIRPSIIAPTWKGALPSYGEEGVGLVDLSVAVGKGFARVLNCDPEAIFDLIPADIVANAHVVAGWSVANQRSSSSLIVNCTGGHTWKLKFGEYCSVLYAHACKHMLPNTFQKPSLRLVKNRYACWMLIIYEHYIPAYILDTVFFIKGSKFRLTPLYKFFERVMKQLSFFMSTTFSFAVDNFNALSAQLDLKDKEIFYMDLKDVSLEIMVSSMPTNTPMFSWSKDKKSKEEREKLVHKRTILINFVKRFSLALFVCLISLIIYKLI